MDKFIFITKEGDPLPIADRLRDEGKDVVVGLITEAPEKDSPDKEECRKSLYKGILPIDGAEETLQWMEQLPDKDDWFVMFDYGDLWPWSERVLDMGFKKGVFPTEQGYKLEDDRKAGKAFAEKYYPDLKVAPVAEFKKVEEAIQFLDEQEDKIFVLKSEGSNAETVVPMTLDPELAKRQILGALKSEAEDYEKDGFTLEEKIARPIEISPVMVFWEGKPLFSLVEFENKNIGAGNIGRLTGGCQNLTMETRLDCRLNEIAFPPVIYGMAKAQPGVAIYDAGLLWNGKEFLFTEFCSQRWGWDGIFSEIAMCGQSDGSLATSRHFDLIAKGENPMNWAYGASVRLFQTLPDAKRADVYQDGYEMDWLDDASNQLYFYCIRKEEGRFLSVGYRKDLGVAVGASDYLHAAVDLAYFAARGFAMTGTYYRPKFDFLSEDYSTSILNRYQFLIHSGLL